MIGEVQNCLQKAIRCYCELSDHLARIEAIRRPEQALDIAHGLERLDVLQEAVDDSVIALAAAFGRDPVPVGVPFPTELAGLMAEIAERTHAATQHLTGLHGLVAAELKQLRENRSAIGSYQPYLEYKGGVLRNAT